jgi:hypothetical protein
LYEVVVETGMIFPLPMKLINEVKID